MYYKKIAEVFAALQGTDVRWTEYIQYGWALNGLYITAPDDCYLIKIDFGCRVAGRFFYNLVQLGSTPVHIRRHLVHDRQSIKRYSK